MNAMVSWNNVVPQRFQDQVEIHKKWGYGSDKFEDTGSSKKMELGGGWRGGDIKKHANFEQKREDSLTEPEVFSRCDRVLIWKFSVIMFYYYFIIIIIIIIFLNIMPYPNRKLNNTHSSAQNFPVYAKHYIVPIYIWQLEHLSRSFCVATGNTGDLALVGSCDYTIQTFRVKQSMGNIILWLRRISTRSVCLLKFEGNITQKFYHDFWKNSNFRERASGEDIWGIQ
jgi:hypothetical protein